MSKPMNQYDLTGISMNMGTVNTQPIQQNNNMYPGLNNQAAHNEQVKKANILMNPAGNDEFDNFQSANTQDNKKPSAGNVKY